MSSFLKSNLEHYSSRVIIEQTRKMVAESIIQGEEIQALSLRYQSDSRVILRPSRFKIGGKIGSGATSMVFKAVPKSTPKNVAPKVDAVALKVLKRDYGNTKTTKPFIMRELKLLQLLSSEEFSHPNIAQLVDVLVVKNRTGFTIEALAFEYADSGDLYSYLSCCTGMSLPIEFCQGVFQQLSRALCHLHGLGIVHSDIKPENILFRSTGIVFLADFGFAQVVDNNAADEAMSSDSANSDKDYFDPVASDLKLKSLEVPRIQPTRRTSVVMEKTKDSTENLVSIPKSKSTSALNVHSRSPPTGRQLWVRASGGTIEYKAPETFPERTGKDFFDGAAADMYSLGVVLHVMLFGRLPRKGEYSKSKTRSQNPMKLFGSERGSTADTWGHSFTSLSDMAAKFRERSLTSDSMPDSTSSDLSLNSFTNSSSKKSTVGSGCREQAMEVVKNLLQVKPERRGRAADVCRHRWVECSSVKGSVKVVKNELRKLQVYRKPEVF